MAVNAIPMPVTPEAYGCKEVNNNYCVGAAVDEGGCWWLIIIKRMQDRGGWTSIKPWL